MDDIVVSFDWAPQIGGAHLWLYEVYRRWPKPVAVFTARRSSQTELAQRQASFDAQSHGSLEVHRGAIPLERIDAASLRCWIRFLRNARMVGRLGAAQGRMLHCLRAFPEGFVGLIRKRMDRGASRLVVYAHGEEVLIAQTSRLLRWMARTVYAGADLVIANSESTRRLVVALCPGARVVVIHPGVDMKYFNVPSEEAMRYRERWPWPAKTVVVATVARMEPRKNHRAVIEALRMLRDEDLPVAYVCAGDGGEMTALRELVKSKDMEGRVLFPGQISDDEKRLIYAASDIYAMPSIQVGEMIEGFGIVFLEAAAAGVPSVGGNVGGQPEAIQDGRTGFIVDGASTAQICDALRNLASGKDRVALATNSRQWAQIHDWPKVVDRTLAAVAGLTRA